MCLVLGEFRLKLGKQAIAYSSLKNSYNQAKYNTKPTQWQDAKRTRITTIKRLLNGMGVRSLNGIRMRLLNGMGI